LGALIGAVAATAKSKSPSEGSVGGCYWTLLTLLAGAVFIFAWPSMKGFGIIVALLFLPVLQLVASIVTLIWIQIARVDFPDKKASLQMLGKITFWSVLGALAGGIAMVSRF
jgi:hypothetical protein